MGWEIMKFEVTINKKHAYLIIAMIMLVGVFVVAQTSTTPVVSHKLSQITKENGVALDITNTNDGKVGIGTMSPAARLDVVGSATTGDTMLRVGSPADVNYRGYDVAVVQGGPSTGYVGTVLNVQSRSLDETGYVLLNVQNAVANTPSSKLYVRGDGNVGIGTVTPGQKLDVAGNVNAQGVCINGNCKTAWSGISGYEVVTQTCNTGGGMFQHCEAVCPSQKRVLGGGCRVASGTNGQLQNNQPSGDGWACVWYSLQTVPGVLNAYAICATV